MIQDYLGFKKQTYHKPSTDTASSLLLLFQGLGEHLEGSIQVVNASPSLSTSGSMQAQVSIQVVNASPSLSQSKWFQPFWCPFPVQWNLVSLNCEWYEFCKVKKAISKESNSEESLK